MKEQRDDHAMTNSNNGTKYICGGYGSADRISSCEIYGGDSMSSLPTPLSGHCMVVVGNSMFSTGGNSGSFGLEVRK